MIVPLNPPLWFGRVLNFTFTIGMHFTAVLLYLGPWSVPHGSHPWPSEFDHLLRRPSDSDADLGDTEDILASSNPSVAPPILVAGGGGRRSCRERPPASHYDVTEAAFRVSQPHLHRCPSHRTSSPAHLTPPEPSAGKRGPDSSSHQILIPRNWLRQSSETLKPPCLRISNVNEQFLSADSKCSSHPEGRYLDFWNLMCSSLNARFVIPVIQIHRFISHTQGKELENTL